jgi:phage N-6-adenine-methyltransferase
VSLVAFRARNHVQQVRRRGANPEVDDRATAPEVFGPLNERFRFTLDVAAASHNAKCERFFGAETDGLLQSWAGERVWCNPPYSNIGPWVAKAWSEFKGCPAIAMLLPANRTEQKWWQEMVEPFRDRPGSPLRTEFIPGRIRFIRRGADAVGPNERPPFGCVLLTWAWPQVRQNTTGRFEVRWDDTSILGVTSDHQSAQDLADAFGRPAA